MILGNVYIGFNFGELGQYILRTDVKVYVIVLAPSSSFSKPLLSLYAATHCLLCILRILIFVVPELLTVYLLAIYQLSISNIMLEYI